MQAAGHSAGNGARNGALGETIAARLLELAAITDEPGHLTRLYLSPAHRKAADLVAAWMREAGMTAQIDALGNVVGRYDARNPGARTLLLGSHIDTVRNAGRFDGALGVVTAVEAVKAASKSAKRFAFAIEVVAFGDEEGVRFASTLGGAKALAGKFAASALDETDDGGVSRRQALMAFGCDPSQLRELTASAERTLGYVEVHIEQGPVLEQENLPVGIVTAIAGVTRATVEIDGVAGHAGTVPMPLRKDALMAAAEMLLAVEAAARSRPGLVATVGKLEVPASATNTIPGRVCFTLDIRSASDRERIDAVAAIRQSHDAIARRRGVSARVLIGHEVPAAVCDRRLSDQLAAAIESFGIAPRRLPSGAGHDAMAFDKVIPFAMLFVRCRGGTSHNPDEYASPADIDIAAGVLLNFLERIESQ
ncbi:MAG: allantoate amidohydrolase [Hyphomicrobiales bacterium]|nr:allantoate amidohydrolase [Hyphomicrobiales bacterium]